MNIFSIVAHMSLLIHLGHDIQTIAQKLIEHKENFPSSVEFAELIDDAIAILGSGMIAFPADVVKQMVEALTQLKNDLQTTAPAIPAV